MCHTLSLPEELQIIAKNELNEIPERVEEDIAYIRTWLLQQAYINARIDDYTLLMTLRWSKFSLEKTKRKLELSYITRSAFPNVFKNRDPLLPNLQCVLKQNLAAFLPVQNSNDPLWLLFRMENATPETFVVMDIIKFSTMIMDMALREYVSSTIVGRALLIDFKNMSPSLFTVFTPTSLKQLLTCLFNVYPIRLKAMHVINVPRVIIPLINLCKMLLSKKLGDRITYDAVGEESTIVKYLPKSALPIEVGGTGEPFADMCEKLRNKVESYREWFIEDDQYGCDESKIPTTSKADIDLSSVDGSFRKLNVD